MTRVREAFWRRVLGVSPRNVLTGIEESLGRVEARQADLEAAVAVFERRRLAELEIRRDERDDNAAVVERLGAVRRSKEYERAFTDPEPLVTVRIASYLKTEELIEVAIASVQRQTYPRIEMVVVNDGPNPVTAAAIERLGDDRIRYIELAEQGHYPDDPHLRWMVAGVPGANLAAAQGRGSWIAPLDDDDEFSPDHVQKLLALARAERAELAYGATVQEHLTHGTQQVIWSSPPRINQFSFLGALYMKAIGFIEYDPESWRVDEPADWNLIRRMSRAGVKMAATEDVVGTMYTTSYTHKDQ
jgi:hypothetical protein